MTNTQHTPGPWHVTPDNYAVYEKDGYGYRGGTICTVSRYGSTYDNRAANARLIAAAPELLAALQAVADYWAGGDVPADIDAAMRAAIAKATGQ